jgi:hypothetical protein
MAYSQEQKENIFNEVCKRIAEGEALSKILLSKGMPSRPKFYEWIESSQENVNKYARATELRAELIFEEIFEIADAQSRDVKIDKEGNEIINHDVINRNRLQIDARKWALSKMNPKKYGEKITTEHQGEIKTNTTIIVKNQEQANQIKESLDKIE